VNSTFITKDPHERPPPLEWSPVMNSRVRSPPCPYHPPPPFMYKRRQRSIKRNKDSFVLSIQVHSTYFILNTSSTHRITLSVRRHSQRAVQDHPEKVSQDGEASTYHYSCKFDPLSSGLSRSNKHTQTSASTMSSWPVGSQSPLDSTRGGP
jgi:hypothetical protein